LTLVFGKIPAFSAPIIERMKSAATVAFGFGIAGTVARGLRWRIACSRSASGPGCARSSGRLAAGRPGEGIQAGRAHRQRGGGQRGDPHRGFRDHRRHPVLRGHPEIDALYREQAGERDARKREALLHHIQQAMHERVMFAPIVEPAFLNGVGPRVDESGLGLIAGHLYSAPYEDLRIKPARR